MPQEMGCSSTKNKRLNVVLLGSAESGKTTLLYKMRLKNANPIFDPTNSFNYEIVRQKYRDVAFELHTFDLSGKQELQVIWPMFYENMPVDVLCIVVHSSHREKVREVQKIYKRLINEKNLINSMKIIVSNLDKRDQINAMSTEEIRKSFDVLASIPIIEIDCKTGRGLVELYNYLYQKIR